MGARILILEADNNARAALRELLTDEGYEVYTAGDGLEGLAELLVQFEPDLVLADADQARLCAPTLSAHAGSATLPAATVVIMSINPESGRPDLHVLAKPIEVDELLRTIERALSTRGLVTSV